MIKMRKRRMTPSCVKSLKEYLSWILYHFVYGTPTAAVGAANNPTLEAVALVKVAGDGTGDGSAAPAKSAKSRRNCQ